MNEDIYTPLDSLHPTGRLPMTPQVQGQDWFNLLVDDCKAIITEAVFTSRWTLVEGYHELGKRLRTDLTLDREATYGKKIVSDLSKSIGQGERTIYRAIQFYDKYPNLDELPEGKNITWNKIVTKYLPETAQEEPKEVKPDWEAVADDLFFDLKKYTQGEVLASMQKYENAKGMK